MTAFSTLMLVSICVLPAGAARAQMPTYAPLTSYATAPYARPNAIRVVDVNGDAKLDVLTANNDNTVGVYLGNGNGTFQPFTAYPTGGSGSYPENSFAVADVNADNKPDLLVANEGSSSVGVLLGNGNGTFQPATTYAVMCRGIAVADMNKDDRPDLLVVNQSAVGVLLGNGNGTFQPTVYYSVGNSAAYGLAVGDTNADDNPDLLTANLDGTVGVLLGTSTGTLQPMTTYSCGASNAYNLAVADLNGDSKLDVVTANYVTLPKVGVLLGTGTGAFQSPTVYQTNTPLTQNITIADLNNDGKPDLLAGGENDVFRILLGNGQGTFSTQLSWYLGANHTSAGGIAVADVNGDGRPDMLVADRYYNSIYVFISTLGLATRAALPGVTATLSPNPATTAATLSLAGLPAAVTQVQATLLDATGRAVARHTLPAAQGSARTELPTAGLAAGLYVLRLEALDAQGQLAGSLPAQRLSVR